MAAVVTNSDLELCIYYDSQRVPLSKVNYLLSSHGNVRYLPEMCNVLALAKSWCSGENDSEVVDILLKQTSDILMKLTERNYYNELLTFIIEQLRMLTITAKARHYD